MKVNRCWMKVIAVVLAVNMLFCGIAGAQVAPREMPISVMQNEVAVEGDGVAKVAEPDTAVDAAVSHSNTLGLETSPLQSSSNNAVGVGTEQQLTSNQRTQLTAVFQDQQAAQQGELEELLPLLQQRPPMSDDEKESYYQEYRTRQQARLEGLEESLHSLDFQLVGDVELILSILDAQQESQLQQWLDGIQEAQSFSPVEYLYHLEQLQLKQERLVADQKVELENLLQMIEDLTQPESPESFREAASVGFHQFQSQQAELHQKQEQSVIALLEQRPSLDAASIAEYLRDFEAQQEQLVGEILEYSALGRAIQLGIFQASFDRQTAFRLGQLRELLWKVQQFQIAREQLSLRQEAELAPLYQKLSGLQQSLTTAPKEHIRQMIRQIILWTEQQIASVKTRFDADLKALQKTQQSQLEEMSHQQYQTMLASQETQLAEASTQLGAVTTVPSFQAAAGDAPKPTDDSSIVGRITALKGIKQRLKDQRAASLGLIRGVMDAANIFHGRRNAEGDPLPPEDPERDRVRGLANVRAFSRFSIIQLLARNKDLNDLLVLNNSGYKLQAIETTDGRGHVAPLVAAAQAAIAAVENRIFEAYRNERIEDIHQFHVELLTLLRVADQALWDLADEELRGWERVLSELPPAPSAPVTPVSNTSEGISVKHEIPLPMPILTPVEEV